MLIKIMIVKINNDIHVFVVQKFFFEIQKMFKNTKHSILNMKSMLLSNTKSVFSQIQKMCCF